MATQAAKTALNSLRVEQLRELLTSEGIAIPPGRSKNPLVNTLCEGKTDAEVYGLLATVHATPPPPTPPEPPAPVPPEPEATTVQHHAGSGNATVVREGSRFGSGLIGAGITLLAVALLIIALASLIGMISITSTLSDMKASMADIAKSIAGIEEDTGDIAANTADIAKDTDNLDRIADATERIADCLCDQCPCPGEVAVAEVCPPGATPTFVSQPSQPQAPPPPPPPPPDVGKPVPQPGLPNIPSDEGQSRPGTTDP